MVLCPMHPAVQGQGSHGAALVRLGAGFVEDKWPRGAGGVLLIR